MSAHRKSANGKSAHGKSALGNSALGKSALGKHLGKMAVQSHSRASVMRGGAEEGRSNAQGWAEPVLGRGQWLSSSPQQSGLKGAQETHPSIGGHLEAAEAAPTLVL